jgi:hypothetical protein
MAAYLQLFDGFNVFHTGHAFFELSHVHCVSSLNIVYRLAVPALLNLNPAIVECPPAAQVRQFG